VYGASTLKHIINSMFANKRKISIQSFRVQNSKMPKQKRRCIINQSSPIKQSIESHPYSAVRIFPRYARLCTQVNNWAIIIVYTYSKSVRESASCGCILFRLCEERCKNRSDIARRAPKLESINANWHHTHYSKLYNLLTNTLRNHVQLAAKTNRSNWPQNWP
jgi:hypothetical protein